MDGNWEQGKAILLKIFLFLAALAFVGVLALNGFMKLAEYVLGNWH